MSKYEATTPTTTTTTTNFTNRDRDSFERRSDGDLERDPALSDSIESDILKKLLFIGLPGVRGRSRRILHHHHHHHHQQQQQQHTTTTAKSLKIRIEMTSLFPGSLFLLTTTLTLQYNEHKSLSHKKKQLSRSTNLKEYLISIRMWNS
jgi:hypothetical protein